MSLFGPPNIEKMKAKRDVKGLVSALGYQREENVRQTAAIALCELNDCGAIDLLIAAFKAGDSNTRSWIVYVMGTICIQQKDAALRTRIVKLFGDTLDSLRKASLSAHPARPVGTPFEDSEWGVRKTLVNALGQIGDVGALQPLIFALVADQNQNVRKEAAAALGGLKDARAVELLITAFEDKDVQVREAAEDALVKIGEPALQPLIAALRKRHSSVGVAAGNTLVKIGSPAVASLISSLKDHEISRDVALVLERLDWHPDETEDGARYWIGLRQWEKCVAIGGRAVHPLLVALGDVQAPIREAAVEVLGKIGSTRAINPLIDSLMDQESSVRKTAVHALAVIGDPRATVPLINALRDTDAKVAVEAAAALGKIGSPDAVDPLLAALWRNDVSLCQAAIKALGMMGDVRAVGPLVEKFQSQNQDIRNAAVLALRQIGEPALRFLNERLRGFLRETDANVLDELGWQPQSDEDAACYWIAKQEWDKCVETGASTAVPLLIAVLKGTYDKKTQAAAAATLDKLGWQPKNDEDGAWYWRAKQDWRKCIEIGEPALGPLIDHLGFTGSYDLTVIEGLGKMGHPRAIGPLIRVLHRDQLDLSTRRVAARALVDLYRSDKLTMEDKQSILAVRNTIITPHEDKFGHWGYDAEDPRKDKCTHFDTGSHRDTGISVDFPL